MKKIKVAIIGAGNCAKSLVEGVQFYSENNQVSNGIMRQDLGGYKAENIEFVCAFDIDERKIDLPLGKALKQRPNCAWDIVKEIKNQSPVYSAPVIDGYALLMDGYPESNRFLVSEELRNSTEMNRTNWTDKKAKEWKEKIISQLIPKNQDTNTSEDKIKSKKSTKESKIEEINSTLEKKQN